MKAAEIRRQILQQLGITKPTSFGQATMIDLLIDSRMEYQIASESLLQSKRDVDEQHWRKQKIMLRKDIERLIKSLGLNTSTPKEQSIDDIFPEKKKGKRIVEDDDE